MFHWSRYFAVVFPHKALVTLSRWQSCCMLEGQESTCTCCAIFSAVLLGLESGLHPSFRLVRDTVFIFYWCIVVLCCSCQWLCIQMTGVFLFSSPDSSLGEHLWSSALHASSGHPNVTCQVSKVAPLTVTLFFFNSLHCELFTPVTCLWFSMRIQVILSGSNNLTPLTSGFFCCVSDIVQSFWAIWNHVRARAPQLLDLSPVTGP